MNAIPPTRLVVFTGDLAFSVRKGIVEIDGAIPGLSWLVVLHSPRRAAGRTIRSQWRNLRRNGWRWIPYQAADLWQRSFMANSGSVPRSHPGGELTRSSLEHRGNLRVAAVPDINSSESREIVAAFAPDLGLALASPILRPETFSIPKLGTLNLHKGRLPDFRGMPPAFWELWNDEKSVGCTVHWVDEKLDTGAVVRETSVDRSRFSTVRGLQLQLDEAGVALMRDAVSEVLSGSRAWRAQASPGRTYRKPTLSQISTLERRLAGSQHAPLSASKRTLKAVRSAAAHSLWGGLRRLVEPRITVLLYHRVSDDVRDNLTVGIEQFDRQMALLSRHCRPLSIAETLAQRRIARSPTPLVAVTFDDGYLDNYANAAPILRRHGIPAAFFVSTGIIGTDRRFPHDVRRGNPPIAVMNWDQLRSMRDWGFVVGSHSASHIDCASEPEEVVRAELAESRDCLRRELGVTNPIFAYPYGGRDNMTSQRLQLVKDAGYVACLSAYGGANVGAVDAYNVLRRGIHWEFSDRDFVYECLGL
jgi:peptidoglycan/xylan/chitin deacetylase (PgdA/CDA1 family)